MKKVYFLLLTILIISCAKIPIESLTLADAINKEGERMHALNITLLNKMFNGKKNKIDIFIKDKYTPKVVENFKKTLPDNVDVKKDLTSILIALAPEINSTRDQMQNALENQRIKLITKLNSDFKKLTEVSSQLRKLINSAIKVSEARKNAFNKLKLLTQNKVDLNQFENEIDKFISKGGEIGKNINTLNTSINSLIK